MTAETLFDAQLTKARFRDRVKQAEADTVAGSRRLAELAGAGASTEELTSALERTLDAHRRQLLLIIEAVEVDRRVREASA